MREKSWVYYVLVLKSILCTSIEDYIVDYYIYISIEVVLERVY